MQGGEGPISTIIGKYLFISIKSQVFTKNLEMITPMVPPLCLCREGVRGRVMQNIILLNNLIVFYLSQIYNPLVPPLCPCREGVRGRVL
jgi:hypothetical protein